MKKNLLYICLMTLTIAGFAACDGMDATYKEFIKDGPIVYIGKADSLEALPGRNRVKLAWEMLNDPRGVKACVYWRDRTEKMEFELDKSIKEYEFVIDNLEEASYVFEVIINDKYGNSSLPVEVATEVYGDLYASFLNPRPYVKYSGKAVYQDKNNGYKWAFKLGATKDQTMTDTEVAYVDADGQTQVLHWDGASEHLFFLEGYAEGNVVKYRSCFLPRIDAIDVFWTPWTYLVGSPEEDNSTQD